MATDFNKAIYRYLDTVGDGTGTKNAVAKFGDNTFTAAATDLCTITAHGYSTGMGPFTVSTSDTLPDPLAASTDYYIIYEAANTFKLATSLANALADTAVDITDTGTGTHTLHAVQKFKIAPASGETMELARMIVSITDVGAPDSGKYGNDIDLTNGITMFLDSTDDVDNVDITDSLPIKTNSDWGRLAGVDVQDMAWGTGNDQVVVRFTFEKSGVPLVLHGGWGHVLEVTLNDNFSGLVEHYFMVQGRYV